MRWTVCIVLLLAGALTAWPQEAIGPAPADLVIQTGAQEVLLDVIVRDKGGRAVLDLKPEEIEVREAGSLQELKSFRLVSVQQGQVGGEEPRRPGVQATAPENAARTDAFASPQLLTFVFERLGGEARQRSEKAAAAFLEAELNANVYASVFTIDQRLRLLQPFTNDVKKIRKAVRRAGAGAFSQYEAQSARMQEDLQESVVSLQAVADDANPVTLKMAQVTLSMVEAADRLDRQQRSHAAVTSLTALVEGQKELQGRKTVIYFSEGMSLPANQIDAFRSVLSAANLAQISFYAVDARGLMTTSDLDRSRTLLQNATDASLRGQRNNQISPDEMRAIDTAQESIRASQQGSLAEMASRTGGFLIANTNDFRKPLAKVWEDISTYYEVTYRPPPMELDGSYRPIEVIINRPNVEVRTRDGYYAVPNVDGSMVLPYEAPLMAAIQTRPMPSGFDYRVAVKQFPKKGQDSLASLVLDIPLRDLTLAADEEKDQYRAELTVLAQLRDAQGGVVHKASQRLPLGGPTEQIPALRSGNFTFYRNWPLAPGRYLLETAVQDIEGQQIGAKRSYAILKAPASSGVALSSVSLIRTVEAADPNQAAPPPSDDPFRLSQGRIIPNLDENVKQGPNAQAGFYFIVHPDAAVAEAPKLTMQFHRDGKIIAQGAPELPEPEAGGTIPYIAMTPIESLEAGRYEMVAIVEQGASRAEERAFFTIVP